jgi:hypothetical protein
MYVGGYRRAVWIGFVAMPERGIEQSNEVEKITRTPKPKPIKNERDRFNLLPVLQASRLDGWAC